MPRLGLRVPKENGIEKSFEYSQLAVDRGFESLWVPEGWSRNRVVLMTMLADRFDDIDIGAGILNIYSRTPGLMAMTAAALDDVADNFLLGLGTSDRNVMEGFHGVPFGNPLRREREYIEIINTLLAGETADYDGKYFDISGFNLRHVDEPYDVPIYLASMGETNLELTGEFADGWLPLFVPVEKMESRIEYIERGLDRQGRSRDDIDVAPFILTCISEEDPEGAKDVIRSLMAFYVGAMGEFHHRNVSNAGYEEEADTIREHWEADEHDEARNSITEEMLSSFAICGTPEEAHEALEQYYENDVDMPIIYIPPRAPDELIRETINHL